MAIVIMAASCSVTTKENRSETTPLVVGNVYHIYDQEQTGLDGEYMFLYKTADKGFIRIFATESQVFEFDSMVFSMDGITDTNVYKSVMDSMNGFMYVYNTDRNRYEMTGGMK